MIPQLQNRTLRARLLGTLFCLALSGCEVGPDYHAPEMKLPENFLVVSSQKTQKDQNDPVIDAAEWWKSFGDDTINKLIDRAVKANLDLDIVLSRLQQARERETAIMGEALPEVQASVGAAKGTGSDLARGRAAQTLVSAENTGKLSHVTQIYGFDAGWELDLFGKYRREAEAAHYDTQAAAATRNNVLITVIADVVRAYTDMRGLQMRQKVLIQDMETAKQYVDFVQQRFDRGITNGLDLALARRELASLQAQSAPLAAQISAAQYTLAVLCGEFPENMAQEVAKPGLIPHVPEKLQTGVPLDLLRRRPDIHEAERELAGDTARIGVATANLFPHFSLMGSAGYQGQGLGVTPVENSFIWSLGPSINWPVLDFGTLDALVNIADLHTHAMLNNYKQKVLNAVEEVDTATSAYAAQQDRLKDLDQALEASQQALSLASQRYDRGLTDYLNVIDAQRQQFELEQQYVIAQQTATEQFIALYKALGDGWEQYQSIPPIHQPQPAIISALQHILMSP